MIQYQKLSLDGDNRGRSADGKRMSKKEFVNSNQATFKEKRNLKWQDFNYRKKNEWLKLENQKQFVTTVAGFVREKNRQKIYKTDIVQDCDNLIKMLDEKQSMTSEARVKVQLENAKEQIPKDSMSQLV